MLEHYFSFRVVFGLVIWYLCYVASLEFYAPLLSPRGSWVSLLCCARARLSLSVVTDLGLSFAIFGVLKVYVSPRGGLEAIVHGPFNVLLLLKSALWWLGRVHLGVIVGDLGVTLGEFVPIFACFFLVPVS